METDGFCSKSPLRLRVNLSLIRREGSVLPEKAPLSRRGKHPDYPGCLARPSWTRLAPHEACARASGRGSGAAVGEAICWQATFPPTVVSALRSVRRSERASGSAWSPRHQTGTADAPRTTITTPATQADGVLLEASTVTLMASDGALGPAESVYSQAVGGVQTEPFVPRNAAVACPISVIDFLPPIPVHFRYASRQAKDHSIPGRRPRHQDRAAT